jgi:sialidase-1
LTADSTRWIHQWQTKGSQPGFGVKETSQFLITKSTDNGLTWSEPINITRSKKRDWWLFAPAPGHGITLTDGTLVFPTQGRDENGMPFSNITWSRDSGKTWTTSNPAYEEKNTTECMAVQLSDGSIMLNMRDNRNRGNREKNGRRICVTTDLGETWTEHPTSHLALIEPTCMASIHKHVRKGQSILLFCNPASYSTRDHITLKASLDDGLTWPEDRQILLDESIGRGYSCITSVNDSIVGVLYESGQADLVFQQIPLKELLND